MKLFSDKTFYVWNAAVTIAALGFLLWLIYLRPQTGGDTLAATSSLPALNAALNAAAATVLAFGYWAIKTRRERLHRTLMLTAFVISAVFLACYIYYHSLHGDTKFLGQGWVRPTYFAILISHIVLSMIVFPLVLAAIFFGLSGRRAAHRRIARVTLPLWLYVSITGVAIFFLLRNYA